MLEDVDNKVNEIIQMIIKLSGDVKKVSNIKDAFELVPLVVKLVELSSFELESEEKKDVATKVLNYFVDLPYVPEVLEEKLFDVAIDVAIIVLNELFGKNWIEKIK